ncbi:MAG: alkaline phosphatase family protein [Ardenticatenaceae bacterium]|nr:alkaline phosphatase family protein [Ardenticatenaceae bacterium]MCB8987903.1 alkaline phosphatase family protein [Ardenticatenaceae bacterium]
MKLNLPQEFVIPDYSSRTIGNVPATIAALLGVPFTGLRPLPSPLWQPLGPAKRVVLLIMDAFGWNLFQKEQHNFPSFMHQPHVAGQITSIFPSTTVAALSSLWTGLGPAQHGMVGLNLFMPQYAVTMQTLAFTPSFEKHPDALIKAGLEPEKFLEGPGFAEQLRVSGVPTYAFKGREIVNSALSKMHGRGVAADKGIVTVADMFVQMRLLLESKVGEPLFVSAYWPTIDTLSHVYGWDHPAVAAELWAILAQLQREFFDRLSPAARRETVFLLVADHGQIHTPAAQQVFLEDYPALQQMLFMTPAGEPRTPYLYVKNGRQADVISYIQETLNHAMVALPAQAALSAGLLGPEPHASVTSERVGDVLVTMRSGYVLLLEKQRESAQKMIGRHGGMTAAEMQVPWLGYKLDA